MKDLAKAALVLRVCVTEPNGLRSESKWTRYCQVVKYQLPAFVIDHEIADSEAEITNFKRPRHMPSEIYLEVS